MTTRNTQSPALPPAWEAAITNWASALRVDGKSAKTCRLRGVHVRSVAGYSRTARPEQLTPDTITAICHRQRWENEYRRDIRTSLTSFYDWANTTGLTTANPARAVIEWCEWPDIPQLAKGTP